MKNEHKKYFNQEGHINELGTAVCVERVMAGKQVPSAFFDHLDTCFECRQTVLDVIEIKGKVEIGQHQVLFAEEKTSQDFHQKSFIIRNLSIAATLLLLIGVVISFSNFNDDQSSLILSENIIEFSIPTLIDSASGIEVVENQNGDLISDDENGAEYERNPDLDQFIGVVFRGSYFEMVEPEIDSRFCTRDSIQLFWHTDYNNFTIAIADNKNIEIHKESLSGNEMKLLVSKQGLYYIKVFNEFGLIYVSRFLIK